MNKKLLSAIIITSLIATTTLTGCKKKTEDTSEKTRDLPKVTLKFYLPGKENEYTREVLDKVEEESKLNIKLDFKLIDYEKYHETIKKAIASSEKFDGFAAGKSNPWRINYIDMFREGKIKDITELLPKYAPAITKQLSGGELDASKVDGKVMFIPPVYPMVNCLGIYLKKDIAEKYKISSINTFSDYDVILKKIKKDYEGITPGTIRGTYNYDLGIFANAYNYGILDDQQFLVYKLDDPNMKVMPWEQTPEFKETTNLISGWQKDGYIGQFGSGVSFGSIMSFGDFQPEETVEKDFSGSEKFEQANYYRLYKEKRLTRKSPANFMDLSCIAFSSTSENTDRALMFLNWIQKDQKNYDLFNYGILGKNYNLKDEKLAPVGNSELDINFGWLRSPFFNHKLFRFKIEDGGTKESMANEMKFINANSDYLPHTGFYPDYRNLQDEFENRKNIYGANIVEPLQRGIYDVNQSDNIIEELKNAGTNQIVNEVQKQLDKWRSLNK